MSRAAWIFTFKLKKNITDDEFTIVTKKLHDELVSKADGFVSWVQYKQKDIWTDFVTWETIEDANAALTIGKGSEIADNFYSKIQLNTCKTLVTELKNEFLTVNYAN